MKSGNSEQFKYIKLGKRIIIAFLVMATFTACSSRAAREAELAALESARITAQLESARVAEARQRQQQAREARTQQVLAAEQARREAEVAEQAEQERQLALARAEADAREKAERDAAARMEQERLQAIASAETQRDEKLSRIDELDRQIASIDENTVQTEAANEVLSAALTVAEELLDVLTLEQAKYDNTDVTGRTVEPLSKGLIAELMAERNSLIEEVNRLTR